MVQSLQINSAGIPTQEFFEILGLLRVFKVDLKGTKDSKNLKAQEIPAA